MQQINRSSKHKEKLNYLNGILSGWNSIYEVLERRVFFFMETEVDDIYYKAEDERLQPAEGDTKRYTVEQIKKIRKMPNTIVMQGTYRVKENTEDEL